LARRPLDGDTLSLLRRLPEKQPLSFLKSEDPGSILAPFSYCRDMLNSDLVNAADIYCNSGAGSMIFAEFVYKNAIQKVR
jgi:hypothetical protein